MPNKVLSWILGRNGPASLADMMNWVGRRCEHEGRIDRPGEARVLLFRDHARYILRLRKVYGAATEASCLEAAERIGLSRATYCAIALRFPSVRFMPPVGAPTVTVEHQWLVGVIDQRGALQFAVGPIPASAVGTGPCWLSLGEFFTPPAMRTNLKALFDLMQKTRWTDSHSFDLTPLGEDPLMLEISPGSSAFRAAT